MHYVNIVLTPAVAVYEAYSGLWAFQSLVLEAHANHTFFWSIVHKLTNHNYYILKKWTKKYKQFYSQ